MAVTEIDAKRRQNRAGISAAAIRLDDAGASSELGRQIKRFEKWQEEAINFTRVIGEIRYAIDYDANQLARCPLYVAARPDASSAPIPADDPDSGISPDLARRANEVLRTLQAPIGGQAQVVYGAETNTRVAGEWWLLNYQGDNEAMHGWHVRSSLDMKITDARIESKGLGEFTRDQVSRIWQPDPFMFEKATSGMRAVLGQCELVLRCDRQFEAALTSRLFAGLLLLSNGFRTGMDPASAETAGDGEAQLDPVIADVLTAFATAIQTPGTAAANVPNTLWGDREDVKDGARLLEFHQQIDPAVMDLREKCLRRIAQGLDLPPEIVLGIADVNHWSAWAIGEEAVQLAEPKAAFLADAFTKVFLHPQLLADTDVDPAVVDRLEVAFDLAPLRKRPNADEDIKYAYEHGEVGGVGLRRVLQIPESDAPDDKDIERWLVLNKGIVGPNLTTELLRRNIASDLADVSEGNGSGSSSSPSPSEEPVDGAPEMPAAAASVSTASPSSRLSAIDIALTERLFAASLVALRRALEDAGLKAKRGMKASARRIVEGVVPSQIVATLGPGLLAAADLTEEELLAGALAALRADFDRWVAAAQADALDAAIAMAGADPDAAQLEEFVAEQSVDREDAWEWFEAAAMALLIERMLSGQGLADWEVRDLVRRSLARAGGADELAPFVPGLAPFLPGQVATDVYGTGLATGPLIIACLASFGLDVVAWEWEHGEPAHPFPPHAALSGDVASTPDGFGSYTPGDHKGCTCAVVPIFGRLE